MLIYYHSSYQYYPNLTFYTLNLKENIINEGHLTQY